MDTNESNRQQRGQCPPPLPNQREQLPSQLQQKRQKKKCRGNRRDQRFRRKYRARNMKPGRIEKLLRNRDQMNHNHHQTTTVNREDPAHNRIQTKVLNEISTFQKNKPLQPTNTTSTIAIATTEKTTATATTNQIKRKRDISLQELQKYSTIPKSTSTISMLQPSLKKLKEKRTTKTIPLKKMKNNIIQQNYRYVFMVLLVI
jgi:hypothetical protein